MPRPDTDGTPGPNLDLSILKRILSGVAIATKAPAEAVHESEEWFTVTAGLAHENDDEAIAGIAVLSLDFWDSAVLKHLSLSNTISRGLIKLTINVAAIRQLSRSQAAIDELQLRQFWKEIYSVLNIPDLQDIWTPSRSAQGFLAVPLCSIIEDGKISELIRLHVWLPDGKRGNPGFSVHSHQPFAQSWVLAGAGTDRQYNARGVDDAANATHAEFGLFWNTTTSNSKTYATHQQSSVVRSTGKLVYVEEGLCAKHQMGDTYTVPAGTLHSSSVAPDTLHATFFYFDSSRGFIQDAPVLGPVDAEPFTQVRDPAGETPKSLASYVDSIFSWEEHMREGRQHAQKAEWEHALRSFNSALSLCVSLENAIDVRRYRGLVLGELGNTNRRFGRYEAAENFLKRACNDLEGSEDGATFNGELGVVYRHMSRFDEAKRAFENQYSTAKHLGLDFAICRAVGNLGMVNYLLAQLAGDDNLLALATSQQQERIDRCNELRQAALKERSPLQTTKQVLEKLDAWSAIGLTRMSLCHTAQNNLDAAMEAAVKALDYANKTGDSTVAAISRFFVGRIHAMKGNHTEALRCFDTENTCTPVIAFCKEPSDEHRGYLQYLVDVGANIDLTDEHGYRALEYAIFNGDWKSRDIVLNGLRRQFGSTPDVEDALAKRIMEASLRKGYRELFQEKLRPVLLEGGADCVKQLRATYATALAEDSDMANMFAPLRVVSYKDFLSFGRLPRSNDGLTQSLIPAGGVEKQQCVVFFSYRWLSPLATSTGGCADDADNTQYKRMLSAIRDYLAKHPEVDADYLSLWIDYACVDQEDPASGVAALPMILSQCDAMISLIDDQYYHRAWCSVEVLLISRLKRSYNMHEWYEQEKDHMTKHGPVDIGINMAEKQLSYERDRENVLFLERQVKLLQ